MSRIRILSLLFAAAVFGVASPAPTAKPVIVTSPDGEVKAELSAADGTLRYLVTVEGKPVLAPSRLGILSNGIELGQDAVLGKPQFRKVDEQYKFFGAHSVAVNRAREVTVPVTSHSESFLVDLHVADDGVGVRLRLPAKAGRKVQADRSSWMLPENTVLWAARLDNAYESHYRTTSPQKLGSEPLASGTRQREKLIIPIRSVGNDELSPTRSTRSADGRTIGKLPPLV